MHPFWLYIGWEKQTQNGHPNNKNKNKNNKNNTFHSLSCRLSPQLKSQRNFF